MPDSGNNWELFGYDMRNVGRHWVAAWRDLLFAYDSPIRRYLDDAVCLRSESGEAFYQAGDPSSVQVAEYSAILLPENLVLSKSLDLPVAVEGDLQAVLSLEVLVNSPFSAEDTGYGWNVVHRDESRIQVLLAIVSKSAVMAYLGRQFGIHDPRQEEVWVQSGGETLVVHGFGEEQREKNYSKRLVRVAGMLSVAALLVFAAIGAAAGLKKWESQQVQSMAATTESESAEASRMRSSLVSANEMIAAANQLVIDNPNPHNEILRLTRLLGDGASIDRFSMNGLDLDLRGRAEDAAIVMQKLTGEPKYAEVSAPRAFSRLKGSRQEQFYLTVRLREGVSQ